MKLDLWAPLDAAVVNEELDDYLTNTESGGRWSKALYFLTQENKCYVQPFLERALTDIEILKSYYWVDDWWRCAVMSVEYFREAFQIEIPIELIRDTGDMASRFDASYIFAFDVSYNMLCSEIVINHHLNYVSDTYLSPRDLIGMLAHETWHAHQVNQAMKFLRRENGIIDFEAINPADFANRGAIYALSNIVMYVNNGMGGVYRCQMAEAEAIYIQCQVNAHLVS